MLRCLALGLLVACLAGCSGDDGYEVDPSEIPSIPPMKDTGGGPGSTESGPAAPANNKGPGKGIPGKG